MSSSRRRPCPTESCWDLPEAMSPALRITTVGEYDAETGRARTSGRTNWRVGDLNSRLADRIAAGERATIRRLTHFALTAMSERVEVADFKRDLKKGAARYWRVQ